MCVFSSVSSCFRVCHSEMTVLMFTVFSPVLFSKIKASHVPVLIICFHWAWLKCWSHHLESDDSDLCFAYAWLESDILQSVWIWSLTLLKLPPELRLSLALTLSSSYHLLPFSKPLKTHTLRNVRHIANYYEPQPRLSLSYCCLDSERVCNFQLAL